MEITNNDIEEYIDEFIKERTKESRYTSFDYCYNYFHPDSKIEIIGDNIEKSCAMLSSYLASWGMYRGSSFLLKEKSLVHYKELIEYIDKSRKEKPSIWKIDVDNYDQNLEKIIRIYNEIEGKFTEGHSPCILVTKIMLGVFGIVPAHDTNFCKAFGFNTFNEKSLLIIYNFYIENKKIIDKYEISTIDFKDSKTNDIKYPKARIIDICGFEIGSKKNNRRKS